MKHLSLAVLALIFVIVSATSSFAVELQARGTWRVAGSWYDRGGDDGAETFRARERARVWFNFIANENLKAVLGLEIGDITWGYNKAGNVGKSTGGALGTDGVNIETKHAYIDFKIPSTEVKVRAGLQGIIIPGNLGSLVLDDDVSALMVSAPINDMFGVTAGWIRPYDENDGTSGTNVSGDEYDTLALMFPVRGDGFSVTPYMLYSMIGQEVMNNHSMRNTLSLIDDATDDATMWHTGFSAKLNMFDPITVMTDFVYGSLSTKVDNDDFNAQGFVFDLAVDYKLDFMTPELFFWYISGEDDDSDNSEIMPTISPNFLVSSFGFDGSKIGEGTAFGGGPVSGLDATTLPSWAIGLKLKKISLIQDLSHTFTIYYAKGTSDKDAGTDFDEEDSLVEINLDSKYQIYKELAAYLELGYLSDLADGEDERAYKCALGIRYDF